jgi:photosystem II stability/assembly factor-like uncharacterized protein
MVVIPAVLVVAALSSACGTPRASPGSAQAGLAAPQHHHRGADRTGSEARWTEQVTYPAPIGLLGTVVCTSATSCVALGTITNQVADVPTSVIATTTDSGASWSSQPLPTPMGLAGLSCPSASVCLAVGGRTGGGGPPTNPNREGEVVASTDGGRSWTNPALPAGVGYLNDLSCASSSFCMAVGETLDGTGGTAVSTSDGGASWTRSTLPSSQTPLSLIACDAPGDCLAVSEDGVLRTVDGGGSWSSTSGAGTAFPASGMACPTPTSCVAVGGMAPGDGNPTATITVTADGGATWAEVPLPTYPQDASSSGALQAISCGSTTTCTAVGGGIGPRGGPGVGVIFTTTNGGSTWRAHGAPPGMGGLAGVSCSGPLDCVVNGTDPLAGTAMSAATTDGGALWSSRVVRAGIGGLEALACPSTHSCVAVGSVSSSTYALRSLDGGRSWTAQAIPPGVVGLSAVSCGSTSRCVAVGFQQAPGSVDSGQLEGVIVGTTDGGATWSKDTLPSGVGNLSGVSCASATQCLAVGDIPYSNQAISVATANGGVSWSPPSNLPVTSSVVAVSCPTPSFCIAAGDSAVGQPEGVDPVAEVTTDAGRTWVGHAWPSGGEEPSGISCLSTKVCVAVGAVTNGVVNGGGVVSGAVVTTTDGGTKWRLSTKVGAGNLSAVSCSASSFCVAAGRNEAGTGPVLLRRDGSSGPWEVSTRPDGGGALNAVSCVSAERCEIAGLSPFGGGLLGRVAWPGHARPGT